MSEKIYGLFCDDKPFYVGRTTQELSKRLSGHLHEAKTGTTAKCRFIQAAKQNGDKEISITLLEEVEAYYNEEELWRQEFQFLGFTLTNEKYGDDETTSTELIELGKHIQHNKKRWKKKKPTFPPNFKQADPKEVARLNALYEADPAEFLRQYENRKNCQRNLEDFKQNQ